MNEAQATREPFLIFACIILGAITGLLIALPFSMQVTYGGVYTIISTILGAAIGRKRASRPFLYFLLFCVLVLSSLVITYSQ